MARPQKSRRICNIPGVIRYGPAPFAGPRANPSSLQNAVILTVDEYEVLRLVDYEGLTHSACASQMNISRTTATEICESARKKVAEAIVCGKDLIIEGGSWELCKGGRDDCFLDSCTRREENHVTEHTDGQMPDTAGTHSSIAAGASKDMTKDKDKTEHH